MDVEVEARDSRVGSWKGPDGRRLPGYEHHTN